MVRRWIFRWEAQPIQLCWPRIEPASPWLWTCLEKNMSWHTVTYKVLYEVIMYFDIAHFHILSIIHSKYVIWYCIHSHSLLYINVSTVMPNGLNFDNNLDRFYIKCNIIIILYFFLSYLFFSSIILFALIYVIERSSKTTLKLNHG